jgi:ABC-2 type transport system permease protein
VAALAFGWRPAGEAGAPLGIAILGTVTFAGLGLLMAGGLRAEATLAGANGLYLIFALIGGMFLPVDHLPRALAGIAPYLPADALADLLRSSLSGGGISGFSLAVLLAWTVAFVGLAMRTFRWE